MATNRRNATKPDAALPRQLFPAHTTIPKGCIAYPVPDGAHFPHLTAGDFAIVDKGQREIVPGELFLIQQSTCQRLWQINENKWGVDTDEQCWMLSPMNKVNYQEAMVEAEAGECVTAALPGGLKIPVLNVYLSDGPIYESDLKKQIIGRVVGVFRPDAEE